MVLLGKTLDASNPNSRQEGASYALRILTAINLLNFADRTVLSAIKDIIKEDLNMTDLQTSLPATTMMIVYMISAAIFGHLIDRDIIDRRYILACAIAFWSFATAVAGFSRNVVDLIALRSLVGVGEAAFTTVSIPVLSDFFPIHERNVAFGIFYLSIPVGGALGFALGAVIGQSAGWRTAFFMFGFPGIAVAFSVLRITKPVPGINDIGKQVCEEITEMHGHVVSDRKAVVFNMLHDLDRTEQKGTETMDMDMEGESDSGDGRGMRAAESPSTSHVRMIESEEDGIARKEQDEADGQPLDATRGVSHYAPPTLSDRVTSLKVALSDMVGDMCVIMRNRHFLFATAGYVANNFCVGGLVDWYATYLHRYFSVSVAAAGLLVGAVTIVAGICGVTLGAKTADRLRGSVKSADFFVPALFCVPATGLLVLALNARGGPAALAAFFLFGAELFCWTGLAPISALSATVVPSALRARSAGLQILLQKMLGDVISPPIIGALSDSSGSLQSAIQVTWVALALCGACWWAGYYFLPPLPLAAAPNAKPNPTPYPRPVGKSEEDKGAVGEREGAASPFATNSRPATFASLLGFT